MGTRAWTRILQAMGKTYPDAIDIDAVCRHTGFDGTRVRRAVWGLVDHGFIEVDGSPSWAGLPWSVSRLTETGLAVAFGVAGVEDDARGTIGSLEAAMLRDLERARTKRSDRFTAVCTASLAGVDVHPLRRGAAVRPALDPANDSYFTRRWR